MDNTKTRQDVWLSNAENPTSLLPVPSVATPTVRDDASLPTLIAAGGPAAQFAWDEFIYGQIRNPYTRKAYEQAIRQFRGN